MEFFKTLGRKVRSAMFSEYLRSFLSENEDSAVLLTSAGGKLRVLEFEDVREVPEGLLLKLGRSKTVKVADPVMPAAPTEDIITAEQEAMRCFDAALDCDGDFVNYLDLDQAMAELPDLGIGSTELFGMEAMDAMYMNKYMSEFNESSSQRSVRFSHPVMLEKRESNLFAGAERKWTSCCGGGLSSVGVEEAGGGESGVVEGCGVSGGEIASGGLENSAFEESESGCREILI